MITHGSLPLRPLWGKGFACLTDGIGMDSEDKGYADGGNEHAQITPRLHARSVVK